MYVVTIADSVRRERTTVSVERYVADATVMMMAAEDVAMWTMSHVADHASMVHVPMSVIYYDYDRLRVCHWARTMIVVLCHYVCCAEHHHSDEHHADSLVSLHCYELFFKCYT